VSPIISPRHHEIDTHDHTLYELCSWNDAVRQPILTVDHSTRNYAGGRVARIVNETLRIGEKSLESQPRESIHGPSEHKSCAILCTIPPSPTLLWRHNEWSSESDKWIQRADQGLVGAHGTDERRQGEKSWSIRYVWTASYWLLCSPQPAPLIHSLLLQVSSISVLMFPKLPCQRRAIFTN
jgi:hypothetical protein